MALRYLEDLLGGGGESSMNASTLTVPISTTPRSTMGDESQETPTEAGAIAGAVFGIVVCLIILGIAAFMYRKHKREREELRRAKRSQMSSMLNAGVYMETTTTDSLVPTHVVTGPHPNPRNSAYKSLNTQPDMYEQDSDDEI
ncbi:uncharacterized protein LOC132560227 isoform X1 [Ylistrum balloti]|uniref:uncharacterized protein LOC132560227 isoform X1 n=2 Tax=Ylistrum balloti TaxID=509963 RepID=UPI002905EB3C|nr:uncharacterized protein LOC132560227 isoform X1 [Ylistrum balloti]